MRARGFTIVELIVVIVITGIIAGTIGVFILRPVQSYDALKRRGELVDAAESALRRMQRDIRSALPNSVRVRNVTANAIDDANCGAASVCVLELLYAVDGGRYRAEPPPGGAQNRFQFGVNETEFDVIGTLQNFAQINTTNDWLVVNNQTTTGNQFNAYGVDNRAQLHPNTNAGHVQLLGHTFSPILASDSQRFFIVNGPVAFLCDTTAGTLTRYAGHEIRADQTQVDTDGELTALGATASRLARGVVGCRFTYIGGTNTRSGLIVIALTVRDANTAEQIRLLHQVHVHNSP